MTSAVVVAPEQEVQPILPRARGVGPLDSPVDRLQWLGGTRPDAVRDLPRRRRVKDVQLSSPVSWVARRGTSRNPSRTDGAKSASVRFRPTEGPASFSSGRWSAPTPVTASALPV